MVVAGPTRYRAGYRPLAPMVVAGPTRYRAVVPTSCSHGRSWAHPLPRGGTDLSLPWP